MKIACPTCRLSIDLHEPTREAAIACPGCGTSVRMPEEDEVEVVDAAEVWLDDEPPAAPRQKPTKAKLGAPQKKTCPMCGERVAAAARRCQSCGETLAGFQDADGYAIEEVWRDGNRLVMAKTALLPGICVQTNQPTSERLRRRLYWHNPWLYVILLAGPLIFIIVALIARESADIKIGLCRERIVRRRWIIFGAWIGTLAGIALCITAGNAGNEVAAVLAITGLLLFLGSMIGGLILARIVAPTKITSRHVWLKGVHPAYLAALPAFPGEP